jgi:predicted lipid-binding transport protein (Tim44 family)
MTDPLPSPFRKPSRSLAKRIGLAAVVAVIAASTVGSLDAHARRLGGGRTIGRQSQTMQNAPASPRTPAQSPTQQSAQPSQPQRAQSAPNAPAQPAPAPSPRSRWLGPIAGLAAGLGIAALLSHFGLAGAFASALGNIIVIALLAMVGIWLVRKLTSRGRRQSEPAYGAAGAAGMTGNGPFDSRGLRETRMQAGAYEAPGGAASTASQAAGTTAAWPADFDAESFLRHAKTHFVRLQAAWDEGNLAELREFTTPEMFSEVRADLDARHGEPSRTDVVQLNAELVSVEDRGTEYLASIRFSGLIRESNGASAEPFSEIWNLSKSSRNGEGWVLAGIDQGALH